MSITSNLLSPLMIRVYTVAAILLAWEAVVSTGTIKAIFLASPTQIVSALPSIMPVFAAAFGQTVFLYALAFTLAIFLGVGIGLITGTYGRLNGVLGPFIGMGLVSPKAVFVHLFVTWFGIGQLPVILFGSFFGFFPILINTIAGVRETKPEYVTIAKSMGFSTARIYQKIVLPAVAPSFLTGLFLGSNLTFVGIIIIQIVFETSRFGSGVGGVISRLSELVMIPELYAFSILTLISLIAINGTLFYLSRRYDKWRLQ